MRLQRMRDRLAGERSKITADAVADLEGVHWVPWNPSFEGLPLKILCANVLRTLRPHWSYAEATRFTVAKRTHACAFRFCNFLHQEFDSCALSKYTYIQAEGRGNHTMSKRKTSQRITTFFEKRSRQGMQDTHSKLFSQEK